MKIWEILKEENVGKKYHCNGEIYSVVINSENELDLVPIDCDTFILTPTDCISMDFEEIKQKITGWERVAYGEKYYSIDSIGTILQNRYTNTIYDKALVKNLNSFSTKEKTEQVRDMNLLQRMMMKFYDEEDGQVNWNDGNKRKYSINYDYLFKEFSITQVYTCKKMNEIYFSSEELAQRCIDEVIKPFMEGK